MTPVQNSQVRHENAEVLLWPRVSPQTQSVDRIPTVVQVNTLILKELAKR